MSIFSLPRAYGNLKRLHEISVVLARHGFGHLIGQLQLVKYVPGLSRLRLAVDGATQPSYKLPVPQRMALVLEDLGATFIKFGQILATRPDLLPRSYLDAFKKLHNNIEPFATEKAINIIETSLSQSLHDIFSEFAEKPIAGGSIGQIHSAVLTDGRKVVVKVKRPGTDSKINDDLDLLLWFASLCERHIPELAAIKPGKLCEDFARSVRRELDFVAEASYTAKFADNLRLNPDIVCPEVIWEHVSRDVLVMSKIEGSPILGPEIMGFALSKRKALSQNLGKAFMEQIFISGLFHADPHPGNIVVTPDGKIGLLDFGQVGHISRQMRQQLAMCLISLNQGEIDTIADIYAEMGGVSDFTNMKTFKNTLLCLIDRYYGVPVEMLDIAQLFEELVTLAREHGISLPGEFVMLGKSQVSAISVAQRLDPDFRIDKIAKPFTAKIMQEQLNPGKIFKGSAFGAYKLISMLRDTPHNLQELLQKAKSGKLRVIFHHEALESLSLRLDRVANRLSLALVIAAIIIGSSMVLSSSSFGSREFSWLGKLPLAYIIASLGFGTALFLGFALILSIFRSDRM